MANISRDGLTPESKDGFGVQNYQHPVDEFHCKSEVMPNLLFEINTYMYNVSKMCIYRKDG